jgi:hypothetical protein
LNPQQQTVAKHARELVGGPKVLRRHAKEHGTPDCRKSADRIPAKLLTGFQKICRPDSRQSAARIPENLLTGFQKICCPDSSKSADRNPGNLLTGFQEIC